MEELLFDSLKTDYATNIKWHQVLNDKPLKFYKCCVKSGDKEL